MGKRMGKNLGYRIGAFLGKCVGYPLGIIYAFYKISIDAIKSNNEV